VQGDNVFFLVEGFHRVILTLSGGFFPFSHQVSPSVSLPWQHTLCPQESCVQWEERLWWRFRQKLLPLLQWEQSRWS